MTIRTLLCAASLLLCGCEALTGRPATADEGLAAVVPVSLPPEGCSPCPPEVRQGLVQEAAGAWPEALALYSKAARVDGHCPHGPLGEARVLLATGRAAEAVQVLAAAARARRGPLLLRALGDALLASGDANAAHEAYAEALRLQPGDGSLRLDAILALYAAGRHEEVAVALADDDATRLPFDARRALGRACLLTGRTQRAMEALSACVEEDPADGAAWLDLARALYLLGEEGPAAFALGRAAELGVDLGPLGSLRAPAAAGGA